jgi:hypothetical protein
MPGRKIWTPKPMIPRKAIAMKIQVFLFIICFFANDISSKIYKMRKNMFISPEKLVINLLSFKKDNSHISFF